MKKYYFRILSMPFGLLNKLVEMAKEGSRDIQNRRRFKGAKIDSGCCINEATQIAPHTHILGNSILNNCKVSSYSYVGRNCLIQNTEIGKFCSIANDVFIGLGKHPTDLLSTSTLFYRVKNTLNIQFVEEDFSFKEYEIISIGHDVWIGARAIVLDGVSIGTGAIIAANSVVTKDVPPYAIVGGVPAKVIKYRFEESVIKRLLHSYWWDLPLEEIKKKHLNNFKYDAL